MALDPTLSLQAGQGVTPLAQPMDLMGKAMSLQGGMLQLQQQKMAMQDEQTMRRLAASGQFQTPDAMANAAMEAGVSPKTVMALKMQGADYQSKVASTAQALATAAQRGGAAQKTKIDLVNEQAQKARALALTAPDSASYQAGLAQLDQQYAQLGVPSLLQKYGQDTPQNRALLATNGATLNDAHAAAFGQTMSTPTGLVNVKQPLAPGAAPVATPVTQAPASDIGKALNDFNASTGKNAKINDPEFLSWLRQAKPNMAAMMMMTGGTNALSPEAKQMLVDKYIQTGQLDSDLSARMPGLRNEIINTAAAQAKQQGAGTPNLAQAKQQFSSAQAAQKYFTTGKGADAFRQQETILHHAAVFSQIADALNNGNVQLANKLGNQFGAQFGSDQATNYKIAGQIFSAEVGKYLAGGQSTAEERKELSDLIPSFSSPQQIKGGLATLSSLVQGQRQSWLAQRDAALKGNVAFGGSQAPAASATPQVMSLADAKATSAASGKTLDQVIQAAKAKGWRIQ